MKQEVLNGKGYIGVATKSALSVAHCASEKEKKKKKKKKTLFIINDIRRLDCSCNCKHDDALGKTQP